MRIDARRPMRPEEYAALRSRAGFDDTPGSRRSQSQTPYMLPAICVGFSLWLIPIIVIVKVLPPRDLVMPFACGSLVVLLAGSFWFFRRRARRKDLDDEAERGEHYAADLQAGEVDEWRLRVVDAVETEGEDEDVGSDFYLELEDGRVLFVSEGDLWNAEYDEDHAVRFPTREVILARLPHADEMLSLHAAGERLTVSGTWPRLAPEAYRNDSVPARGTFLPGPLSRYRSAHHDDDDDGAEEDAR
jgi:hypothetical protein